MTDKQGHAQGGVVGQDDVQLFHKTDNTLPMSAEDRKRLNDAFTRFIEGVNKHDQERIRRLQQEEIHGDH